MATTTTITTTITTILILPLVLLTGKNRQSDHHHAASVGASDSSSSLVDITKLQQKMDKIVQALQRDFAGLRGGKADPGEEEEEGKG